MWNEKNNLFFYSREHSLKKLGSVKHVNLYYLHINPRLLEGFQHSFLIKQKTEICDQKISKHKYISINIYPLNLMSEKNESLN